MSANIEKFKNKSITESSIIKKGLKISKKFEDSSSYSSDLNQDWGKYYDLGYSYHSKNNFREALKYYFKSFDLNNNPLSLTAIGLCYMGLDDHQKSIEFFSKSLHMDPVQEFVYYNRGKCYIFIKDLDSAIDDLNTALDLDDENYDFYGTRGYVFFLQKKYQKAIKNLTRSIDLNPEKFYLQIRAQVFLEINDIEKYKNDIELSKRYK